MRKGDDTLFDITMGRFDGVAICELVGLYVLDKLSNLIEKKCRVIQRRRTCCY